MSAAIPGPLRVAAGKRPREAAVVGDGVISYAELERRVSRTAGALRGSCESGERVALYLPQDERYVVLLLALLRAGMVAVPVSTRVPAEGVSALLERAGCSVLISTSELSPETPGGARELEVSALDGDGELPGNEWRLESPATAVFTSGSTGGPKAALHTLANHYYSALGSNENIPLGPGDRWLSPLPFYHVGGLGVMFRCLLSGAAIALPRPGEPVGESATRLGATHASLVATQLLRLLREDAV